MYVDTPCFSLLPVTPWKHEGSFNGNIYREQDGDTLLILPVVITQKFIRDSGRFESNYWIPEVSLTFVSWICFLTIMLHHMGFIKWICY